MFEDQFWQAGVSRRHAALIRVACVAAMVAVGCSPSGGGGEMAPDGGAAGASPLGGTGGTAPTGGTGGTDGAGGTSGAGGTTSPEGETTVSLDLSNYSPNGAPSSLMIANETLVFPLTPTPAERVLSTGQLGDLLVVNTRVGCNVDPDSWIGAMGAVPVSVVSTPAVALTQVTIDLDLSASEDPQAGQQMAQRTCLTFRKPDGPWQPFVASASITTTAGSVRIAFSVPAARADAAAIFLPTYTYVSRVTYSFRRP